MNSDNNRGNEIEEDVPQYRSVMIGGPLSPPPMPRSFASMGPAKAKMAPRSMQQLKPRISQATIWNVAELPCMPAAYFLERTSVYVDGNPQEIADRICDSLRMASINAQCGVEMNLLHAETSDALRFAVRLFADKGKVVVEVQRRCGCSYHFREAAMNVLRSAQGLKASPTRKISIPSCIPRQSQEKQQQCAEDGFEVALSQLSSNMLDSQLIGMESLEQLTRSECRRTISLKVLGEKCIDKILIATRLDTNDVSTDIEERHFTMMKRRSLTVLANALSALSQAGQLGGALNDCSQLKCSAFISSLVDTLADSANCPHEAIQAARCMQELMIDSKVKKDLVEMRSSSIVASACSSGACRSVLLEEEAKKLQEHFKSC